MLQLGRRFTGHALAPAYTDGEIFEITTSVTTCILMLASKFFAVHNLLDDARAAEQLIETFGPAREGIGWLVNHEFLHPAVGCDREVLREPTPVKIQRLAISLRRK
jgi:hypothetical protein